MRIDPRETIAGQPALLVRQTLRQLRDQLQWGAEDLESATSLNAGKALEFLKTLLAEVLVESIGPGLRAARGRLEAHQAHPITPHSKPSRRQIQPIAELWRLRGEGSRRS